MKTEIIQLLLKKLAVDNASNETGYVYEELTMSTSTFDFDPATGKKIKKLWHLLWL